MPLTTTPLISVLNHNQDDAAFDVHVTKGVHEDCVARSPTIRKDPCGPMTPGETGPIEPEGVVTCLIVYLLPKALRLPVTVFESFYSLVSCPEDLCVFDEINRGSVPATQQLPGDRL